MKSIRPRSMILFIFSLLSINFCFAKAAVVQVNELPNFLGKNFQVGNCQISRLTLHTKMAKQSGFRFQINKNETNQSMNLDIVPTNGSFIYTSKTSAFQGLPESRPNISHLVVSSNFNSPDLNVYATKAYGAFYINDVTGEVIGAVFNRSTRSNLFQRSIDKEPTIFCGNTGKYSNDHTPVPTVSISDKISGNLANREVLYLRGIRIGKCTIESANITIGEKNEIVIMLSRDDKVVSIALENQKQRKLGTYAGAFIHQNALAFTSTQKNVAAIQLWDATVDNSNAFLGFNSRTTFNNIIFYYDNDIKTIIGAVAISNIYGEGEDRKVLKCGDVGNKL